MSFLINLTPVAPFPPTHQNWMMPDLKDVSFSSSLTYYHQCVLDTQGIVHTVSWLNMETSQGVYNFAPLLATLNYASAYGKRVIIRVFYKNYSGSTKPLPAYITSDPTTYGGTGSTGGLRVNSFGATCYTPRFDNANVMIRFKALITAMAAAIGSHAALQGIGPDESAWSFGALWGTSVTTGLTAAMVRQGHRDKCLHMQTCFPTKEIYPFYNFCDGSSDAEIVTELNWSLDQGMCAGITDTHRVPEMLAGIQPVEVAYPVPQKTLMCVDYLSVGAVDSGLTERYLENARTTAARGAAITVWYTQGGASSAYWAAAKNAMAMIG